MGIYLGPPPSSKAEQERVRTALQSLREVASPLSATAGYRDNPRLPPPRRAPKAPWWRRLRALLDGTVARIRHRRFARLMALLGRNRTREPRNEAEQWFADIGDTSEAE